MNQEYILNAYQLAKERYAEFHVNVDDVLKKLESVSLSLHCWQGDDVGGFERPDAELEGGGLQVTGNHPGKARNVHELRQDYEKVLSLIPGKHRVNLHAIYGEFGGKKVDRNEILPEYYQGWIDWAKKNGVKIDFNPTLFSHPKAASGYTLSSKNEEIRKFWIEHCKKSREISAYIGKSLGDPCVCNLWIPDGSKDTLIDKFGYRTILKKSLDEIYSENMNPSHIKDSVEGKLFGIGSESCVIGSHEFYYGYVMQNKKIMLCMDMGHYHPTETIGEKISSYLQFKDELLIHVSRGVRWDSDHVVITNDDLLNVMQEIVWSNALNKIHLALDFFDASINRIGAWIIGARSTLKSLLIALLEPMEHLVKIEECGNNFKRLAMLEDLKYLPYGAVWDYYCMKHKVPTGKDYVESIMDYENRVLLKRVT